MDLDEEDTGPSFQFMFISTSIEQLLISLYTSLKSFSNSRLVDDIQESWAPWLYQTSMHQ